jgi:uncharacterized membrane protein YhaH (DUF805 family)
MNKLFSTKGRINRQRYFFTTLAIALIAYAIAFVIGFAMGMSDTGAGAAGSIGFVIGVGAAIIQAFLVIKRLHDLGKPGWQYFLMYVPLYNIYLGIVLLFVKGTAGPNEYGEDPASA